MQLRFSKQKILKMVLKMQIIVMNCSRKHAL